MSLTTVMATSFFSATVRSTTSATGLDVPPVSVTLGLDVPEGAVAAAKTALVVVSVMLFLVVVVLLLLRAVTMLGVDSVSNRGNGCENLRLERGTEPRRRRAVVPSSPNIQCGRQVRKPNGIVVGNRREINTA